MQHSGLVLSPRIRVSNCLGIVGGVDLFLGGRRAPAGESSSVGYPEQYR